MVRERGGAPPATSRDREASSLGVSFGRYQLLKKLAAGGMAEVYLARQSGLEGFEKLVVIKRILPHLAGDEEFVQMFLNEARIAARFNHANIVQIYDLGKMEETYFIGMEYVHGEDLGRVMRKAWNAGTWIPPQLALRVIAQACEGLHYAHTKADDSGQPLNVVHRDISPQNILVSFDGGVKVVDFGIAKAADSASNTRSGTLKGKYAYMSSEQAQGKAVDARTDVFALGLVLYELLTGVRPLKRDTDIQTLQAALQCEIEPPSKVASISDTLDPLIMKALTRRADDRYNSARDFQLAIEDYLVQNQLAASSVHLSEFMKTLFADRLDEEKREGRPMPSVQLATESQQSFPAINAAPSTGPVPAPKAQSWEAPPGRRDSGEGQRRSTRSALAAQAPAPAPEELEEEDADDGPTTQEFVEPPRRKTGQQRRATGEQPRRTSGEGTPRKTSGGVPAVRQRTRSSASVAASGMPDAPPRTSGESRIKDESWKDSNKPQPRTTERKGSPLPLLIVVLALGAGGFMFRADILRVINGTKGTASATNGTGAPLATTTLTLLTDRAVSVEINGEVVGTTPIRNYPVKPGNVAVHYFDPGQGIDKTVTYAIREGDAAQHREDFEITRVQFKADRAIQADVFLNGKNIGTTNAAPLNLAVGEYEFEAKADNGTLVGTAHAKLKKDTINFVTFTLHRQ
ncbi:MAG: protein kinase [Deltaproteobacteria bacterium]|nr:protein kinase [Deltaproteobacteria bacterium]